MSVLHHLLEQTAWQRELVISLALRAQMREQARTIAGHRDRVEPAGADEARRRGRGAHHVEKAAFRPSVTPHQISPSAP